MTVSGKGGRLRGLAVGLTALSGLLVTVGSAEALTIGADSVQLSSTDVGQSFKVLFDGNVNTTPIAGLTSEAVFKLNSVSSVLGGTVTEFSFDVTLDNTSTNGITSRTSILGFDTSSPLRGVGGAGGTGNTRVSGIFTIDATGSLPNQFGAIDVCFKDGGGPNCSGGGSGGVGTADAPGSFTVILAFNGTVTDLTLDNFGVRYQAIRSVTAGNSGTGTGTPVQPPPPTTVAEPATLALLGLGLLGLGTASRRKAA
jgi:hypothetical protein